MEAELVVDAAWVADHLDSVVPVDVREPWEFEGIGHLPGAVNVPFESFRDADAPTPGTLPTAEAWATLLGEVGIAPDVTLVAYDDMHGVFAARFVVTAWVYGHRSVHLLNGDYSAWAQDHAVETTSSTVPPTEYPIPSFDESVFVDADTVAAAATASDAVLVDTRSPEEFREGHIAGAVNLDWVELVEDSTRRLRDRSELEAVLADRGITADKRVVLYCNTARRISHTYVVLRWLGFDDIGFYEGSLTEWAAQDRPVVEE
ncbi:MAG: sulfurtransferase [Halobacteriaceae archaeon]